MKKSDLLELIESLPDDVDIVFLDDEGNYSDRIEFIEERTLGRFSPSTSPEINFYSRYPLYDNWKFMYEKQCVVLG